MSDNRTNEQIVAEALREGVHVAGGGRSHLAAADVTYALGKAGRLVDWQLSNPGQFTETQVEAAAKALAVYEWVSWGVVPDHIKVMYRGQARAALVAAQGAAPQAESAAAENALDLLERLRVSGQIDYEDYSTMHDHITSIAPELSSSGVDEDKLAEVEAERDAALARVEELEADMERCEGLKAAHMRSVHETVKHNEELLARIAELEAELEVAMRPHSECERNGAEAGQRIVDLEGDLARAEARIAEAAKLHRRDSPGLGGEWCQSDGLKWPCPTAVSLGLNEGENE